MTQHEGEKVCTVCGRVAQREARFCQEGHALVRKCVKCLTEFAIDHQRCDSCGWLQSVKPGTAEGNALAFDRAVSDLADPSHEVFDPALEVIITGGDTASTTSKTAAVSAIQSLIMDPSRLSQFSWIEWNCWKALRSLGPAARQVVPKLRQRLEEVGSWDPAWTAPGVSPVQFLDEAGFLDERILAVHGVQGGDLS